MTDRRPIEESKPVQDGGRPGGTTEWRGSITERGTTMDSYYGRNIVKEPVWKAEIPLIKEHFATFGAKLPKALTDELAALEKRLA